MSTGNLGVGTSTLSSDDSHTAFALPDAKLYVRDSATAGGKTDMVFRGGLEGDSVGKVKLWLASDASHSSCIQNEYRGYGNTMIIFGSMLQKIWSMC